ncbi:MAG: hypothetical protein ACLFU8_00170 [Anaerolineales bacterium]
MQKCKDCVVGLLGVCRLDYCRPERQVLIAQALELAEDRGHTLAEFVKVDGCPIWQTRCDRCGREAAINLDPPRGSFPVYGEALKESCGAGT